MLNVSFERRFVLFVLISWLTIVGCASTGDGLDSGVLQPKDDAGSSDDGGTDAGSDSLGDAGEPGACRLAVGTRNGLGLHPKAETAAVSATPDAGPSETPRQIWEVTEPCPSLFPGSKPAAYYGVVGELSGLQSHGDVFVGVIYQKEEWSAHLAQTDLVGLFAIRASDGETVDCRAFPEPPDGVGFRSATGRLKLHTGISEVLISVQTGWKEPPSEEAAVACPQCPEFLHEEVWRYDGGRLVNDWQRDGALSADGFDTMSLDDGEYAILSKSGTVSLISDGQASEDVSFSTALSDCGQQLLLQTLVRDSNDRLIFSLRGSSDGDVDTFTLIDDGSLSLETGVHDYFVRVRDSTQAIRWLDNQSIEIESTTEASFPCGNVTDLTTSDRTLFCVVEDLVAGSRISVSSYDLESNSAVMYRVPLQENILYAGTAKGYVAVHLNRTTGSARLEARNTEEGTFREVILSPHLYQGRPFVLDDLIILPGTGIVSGVRVPGVRQTESSFSRGLILGGNSNTGAVAPP